MKHLFVTFIIVFIVGTTQSQGIEFFQGTWKDALAKAKAEEKLVFVDAYAKWCGPCKVMAKNVFTQQKVGDFFNANFINLKLDMEEVDGVSFGHVYPVSAYPTLLFLDGEGKLVKKVVGGQQVEGLISHGEDANKKNDKSRKFEEKYLAGDRSYDLVYAYVKALNAASKPSLKISNDYLLSNPDITENQKLLFILEAATEADSKLFDQVISNKSKIIAVTGKKTYEDKCKSACQATVAKAVNFEMESMLTEANSKAKKTFPDDADKFIAKSGMSYYKTFRMESPYTQSYKSLVKSAGKDPETLIYIVKDINKNFKDNKKMMADASEYAEVVWEAKKDLESLGTFCSILVSINETEKAIKVAKAAREKAEKAGVELSGYDGLINYLNSKKA
ncbi:MAG: thioredoxin family protein [Saprospiraceae bacterium]|nr:thioredoxin family protein [Saprospiraceae bacterium]